MEATYVHKCLIAPTPVLWVHPLSPRLNICSCVFGIHALLLINLLWFCFLILSFCFQSLRPWDPLNDIAQFEKDGILQTMERHLSTRMLSHKTMCINNQVIRHKVTITQPESPSLGSFFSSLHLSSYTCISLIKCSALIFSCFLRHHKIQGLPLTLESCFSSCTLPLIFSWCLLQVLIC